MVVEKENRAPFTPAKAKGREKTPEQTNLRERVDELEEKVILRDKKINGLNSEIGDMTLKVMKYRKRLELAGIRCD